MSRPALMISAALTALLATGPVVAKSKLFQLPLVSNSTETIAFGINDSGTITGYWLDSSGVQHGFVGPDNGSKYKSFDDSTDPGTQPRGISKDGTIVGIDNVGTGNPLDYVTFERTPGGTITNVTKHGSTLDYLIQGINKQDIFDGNFENSTTLKDIGYTGKNAKYKNKIKLKGIMTTGVAGRGINNAGDIVGWYLDSGGVQHGFLMPSGKRAITIDDPAGTTSPEGINNKGEISGLYVDSSGNRHGFIYDIATKKFTELKIPGDGYVEVWGLNDQGLVAIDGAATSAGPFTGYIYCPSMRNCPTAAAAVRSQPPVLHRSVQHLPSLP